MMCSGMILLQVLGECFANITWHELAGARTGDVAAEDILAVGQRASAAGCCQHLAQQFAVPLLCRCVAECRPVPAAHAPLILSKHHQACYSKCHHSIRRTTLATVQECNIGELADIQGADTQLHWR